MSCGDCVHPMHEQYQGHRGRWICFCPGLACGRTICPTPVEEWDDVPANNKRLSEAKTPKWCPFHITTSEP